MGNFENMMIGDEMYDILNVPFTKKEIAEAIRSMKNTKAPGIDGMPIEVYKVLWSTIDEIFTAAVHQCYDDSQIYSEAKTGVLNLIPKANKDSRYLKNLRPITLLNNDYKIIDKCIARRMDMVMNKIINRILSIR